MGLFSTVGSKKISAVPVEAEKPLLTPRVDKAGNQTRETKRAAVGVTPTDPRGGRKPFDRVKYQREYMRKYRAAKKVKEK